MENIKTFKFEKQAVSFDLQGDMGLINATQMAKAFGKRPNDFLELPSTQGFIKVLDTRLSGITQENNIPQAVITRKGNYSDGRVQGTWMHELLALKFAAWLSPEFELWVYSKIKELLSTGKTELTQKEKELWFENQDMNVALIETNRINEELTKEIELRVPELEVQIQILKEALAKKPDVVEVCKYSIQEYADMRNVHLPRKRYASLELRIMKMCRNRGIETSKTQEARKIKGSRNLTTIETVGVYPETILLEAFMSAYLISKL